MKLTPLVLALLALAGGLVIAGCGDDDEEPQTLTSGATGATGAGGEATTKAAFIEAADAICEQGNKDFAEEARSQYPEGPPEGEDAAKFAEDVVIPYLESQHEQISALPVPEGEEDAVADILEKLQAGIDEVKENPESFVTTDAFDEANAAAKDFGLKECGEG